MIDLTERLAGIRQRSQEADRKSDRHSDIMALADSQTDVAPLLGVVEAVLELHSLWSRANGELCCDYCVDGVGDFVGYPCATVQAITEHLGATP